MVDPRQPVCAKCNGTMERGFLIDYMHGGATQTRWSSGRAERSWWTGIKIWRRETLRVVTYRCQTCGYLESYAPQDRA